MVERKSYNTANYGFVTLIRLSINSIMDRLLEGKGAEDKFSLVVKYFKVNNFIFFT